MRGGSVALLAQSTGELGLATWKICKKTTSTRQQERKDHKIDTTQDTRALLWIDRYKDECCFMMPQAGFFTPHYHRVISHVGSGIPDVWMGLVCALSQNPLQVPDCAEADDGQPYKPWVVGR